MGKVLRSFDPGWPGAVSRSVDDVIVPMAVTVPSGVAFGLPVVLNSQKTGVIPFASTHSADDFIGVAVRSAAKTPDAYGSNQAQYNQTEMADILVRGSAVVQCYTGTPAPGGPVYIHKASGYFSAEASTGGTDNVLLPNVKFRGLKDLYDRVEIVILERNA